MRVNFKNLVLEVTRKCNMQCAHCMRGDAEDVDMSTDTLQKLFEQIGDIEHLCITGGEPSLNPTAIHYIAYFARTTLCNIGSFFCSTNAKEYSPEFVKALNELYMMCDQKEECTLTVSIDQFHAPADEYALKMYRGLPYYKGTKEKGFISRGYILSEGRANENNLGRFSMPFSEHLYDVSFHGIRMNVGDRIYVNALGDILLDADLSYKNQENERIGNVMEDPLYCLFTSNYFEIPDHWFEKGKKCFYCVHIHADANTISGTEEDSRVYYTEPQKASSAYQSALTNIRITPVSPKYSKIPDDLKMTFAPLEVEDDRCIGTKIRYSLPEDKRERYVTIEILRCPLEEGYYDGK